MSEIDKQITHKDKKKKNKLVDAYLLQEMGIDNDKLKRLQKKLAKAEGRPERGIETWFRLASKNLYTRLQIVDTKANILITANAIIISVVFSSLFSQLESDPHYIFAIAALILTNLLSITFAILATIPAAWRDQKDRKHLNEVDLMNFDEFKEMSLEDYQENVKEVMESGNTLYPSIINDIHKLGTSLSRKYGLIRKSYLIFLIGIIASTVTFIVGHCIYHLIYGAH